eukprot:COSAG05_NODE_13027_length_444_cov_1.139130_1_plen_76_part_01
MATTKRLSVVLSIMLVSAGPVAAAAAAGPAGGTILIAPGVEMPVVANGYSPFTAHNKTTDALETWLRVVGRAVDTA